jgi:hypothetical protein
MNNNEIVISIFEKELGGLKNKREMKSGDSSTIELEFGYKGKMTVQILLIEATPNHWFIYHDLSKENPFLLKKIVQACERIQRIKENKDTSFTLSEDLDEIKKDTFVKTAMKSILQNFFTKYFTLFGDQQEKKSKNHHNNVKEIRGHI